MRVVINEFFRIMNIRARGGKTVIEIINKNFHNARIEEHILDHMIVSNKLIAFRRSNEWVVVGRDPVRERHTYYSGDERRRITRGADFCMK